MEASRFLPDGEPDVPQFTLLRELLDDGTVIHHFYLDGQDTYTIMAREQLDDTGSDFTYHLRFYGWEFAAADVHTEPQAACIEWQGIADDLDNDLAKLEARRLLADSSGYLTAALRADFPDLVIEDAAGNLL
jgi:hypothetical protein